MNSTKQVLAEHRPCRFFAPAAKIGAAGGDPDVRVVIYSNYQDVALIEAAERVGVDFIPKGNLRTLRRSLARGS